MRKSHVAAFFCLVTSAAILAPAAAQGQRREPTASETSYREARRVLDAALAAYGGVETVRSVENYSIRYDGALVHRNQSRRPDPPYDRTPQRGHLIVEPRRGRVYHDNSFSYPGGFDIHWGVMIDGKNFTRVSMRERRVTGTSAPVPPQPMRSRLRWLPHNVVANALERAHQVRSLGRASYERRPHDVVTYAAEDGAQLTLYFDAQTHLLSKFELLTVDPYLGDAVQEITFPEHRTVERYKVPTARVTKVLGEVTEEVIYSEVTFNRQYDDAKFRAPEGFAPPPGQGPAQAPPVQKLSENVYVVNANGYNVLAVGFRDHVLVVETPGDDATSRDAIARIKETFPGKPVRYAAVTHFHDDHAGGLRTYVAEGATVVTTPGNRPFFERAVRDGRFTIRPDALTQRPAPLRIETLQNGKRVFTDGSMTVELYDIGRGPHADEMIVAYLPAEKIIFQGDLLNRSADNPDAPGNETAAHFADWLKRSGLAVERVVGVHGPVATIDQLRRAAEAAAKKP
ncbi:MAG TPA: MBL fold metallo-hydrolase [Pyrinomonadaceae bacterium]|nr:MBL fold metallo-hydrolase [Pyrinomonadaceae bacterium]